MCVNDAKEVYQDCDFWRGVVSFYPNRKRCLVCKMNG